MARFAALPGCCCNRLGASSFQIVSRTRSSRRREPFICAWPLKTRINLLIFTQNIRIYHHSFKVILTSVTTSSSSFFSSISNTSTSTNGIPPLSLHLRLLLLQHLHSCIHILINIDSIISNSTVFPYVSGIQVLTSVLAIDYGLKHSAPFDVLLNKKR